MVRIEGGLRYRFLPEEGVVLMRWLDTSANLNTTGWQLDHFTLLLDNEDSHSYSIVAYIPRGHYEDIETVEI